MISCKTTEAGLGKIHTLKVMSFNVRYENTGDTGDRSWNKRRAAVLAMLADQQPDIMGVQETLLSQKTYLDQKLTGYKSIGVGRNDGFDKGEFAAIFYRKKTLKPDNWGTFWLSETPDIPSKGWDANIYRSATYAVFTHIKSGKKIFIINTHLDHQGTIARAESMKLIEKKIKELNIDNYPSILTGDFNMPISDASFDSIKMFMGDARMDSPETDSLLSFNNWGGSGTGTIDHIFCLGITPQNFHTITRHYLGINYISDHYPVTAEFQFE